MSASLVADLGLGHVRLAEAQAPGPLAAGATYGAPAGTPSLRTAVATWERVEAAEVAITTGASLGLAATLAALPRPCSILCPRPYYPAYPKLAKLLGFELIYYDLREETAWNPCLNAVPSLLRDDTRAVLWNIPSNPIGCLPTPEALAGMQEVVQQANLLVISDEVYADFAFDGGVVPDMRAVFGRESVVRVRSFSKLFGMPGERLGYVIADPLRLQAISQAHWTLAMSPPATAQSFALWMLGADLERRLREVRLALAENREHAIRILTGCDRIKLVVPQAGTFCWIEILDAPCDASALAQACARRAGVVVMPGSAFGVDSPTFLRLSFAVPQDELLRGLAALVDFLGTV